MPMRSALVQPRRNLAELCPWCSMVGVPIRVGPCEVCPECGSVTTRAEEGSERHAQLPEEIGGCARCRAEIPQGQEEACWHCLRELCYACWDAYGHCGHPDAAEANRKARAWKPGDPLLPSPW